MAVKKKEELLETLKTVLGDKTDDATIQLMEDLSDTYDDLSESVKTAGDWKAKYEKNDSDWRKKYRDRFYGRVEPDESEPDIGGGEPTPDKLTYDNLFKEGDKNA